MVVVRATSHHAASLLGVQTSFDPPHNLVEEDFKRAFGEYPGNVTSMQLLPGTDSIGGDALAFYGRLSAGPPK